MVQCRVGIGGAVGAHVHAVHPPLVGGARTGSHSRGRESAQGAVADLHVAHHRARRVGGNVHEQGQGGRIGAAIHGVPVAVVLHNTVLHADAEHVVIRIGEAVLQVAAAALTDLQRAPRSEVEGVLDGVDIGIDIRGAQANGAVGVGAHHRGLHVAARPHRLSGEGVAVPAEPAARLREAVASDGMPSARTGQHPAHVRHRLLASARRRGGSDGHVGALGQRGHLPKHQGQGNNKGSSTAERIGERTER